MYDSRGRIRVWDSSTDRYGYAELANVVWDGDAPATAATGAGREPPRVAGDLRPGDLVYQQAPRGRGVLEHVVRRVAPGPHGVVTIYFSEDFTWVLPVGRLVEARRPGIG